MRHGFEAPFIDFVAASHAIAVSIVFNAAQSRADLGNFAERTSPTTSDAAFPRRGILLSVERTRAYVDGGG